MSNSIILFVFVLKLIQSIISDNNRGYINRALQSPREINIQLILLK
ncbi:MAG: hypothetical protein HeimC2_40530 [Candidatus Heimdallarchaeota archaeon LC_2]|nr:MAG: hypothetical protein HeimC2_40530 [Candidatus Heimdallarchaeota archaeon LC_2]